MRHSSAATDSDISELATAADNADIDRIKQLDMVIAAGLEGEKTAVEALLRKLNGPTTPNPGQG